MNVLDEFPVYRTVEAKERVGTCYLRGGVRLFWTPSPGHYVSSREMSIHGLKEIKDGDKITGFYLPEIQ